jgi:hypothetical protein
VLLSRRDLADLHSGDSVASSSAPSHGGSLPGAPEPGMGFLEDESIPRTEWVAHQDEEGDWFFVKTDRSEAVWSLPPNAHVIAKHPRAAAAATAAAAAAAAAATAAS